ncbi:hypothetical protein [Flavobacterium sp. 3HN19-14]|uniref:hypothetical protein n=1 Tax=Flavobacterium sp. 3HN19-14 TaxID=3448133 RepID=UPI003EE03FD5
MIDFIRAVYKDKSNIEPYLLRQENFDKMYTVLELHSGEISYPYKTNLDILDIIIRDKTVDIKNSLHKLYNSLNGDEPHNHNDFSYISLNSTIDYLNSKLPDLSISTLTQLEFGLNVTLPRPAQETISNNILMHKTSVFNHNAKFNGKGCLIRFDYTNYFIKIYDKAKQYHLDTNILQFEIKLIRKREFNALGIYSLLDLQSKERLKSLFKYLLDRFDEMVIVDDFTAIEMPEKDRLKLSEFLNHRYWEQLSKSFSRQTKRRRQSEFKSLLHKYDLLKTKELLRTALLTKFNFLIEN